MLIILVYVDDIIFGGNADKMSQDFYEEMKIEFDIPCLENCHFS
jgi:hypothetical protein